MGTPENGRHQGRAWAGVKEAMAAGLREGDSLGVWAQAVPRYSPPENILFTNTGVGRVVEVSKADRAVF